MMENVDTALEQTFPISLQVHLLNLRLAAQARAVISRHGDLTLPQWRIIRLIGLDPSRGSTGHRKALGFDKSQFSKTIAALVEDNYISIQPHPTDKRQFVPALTDKGHAALRRLEPELDRRQAHLSAALTQKERELIGPILQKLYAAAETTDFPDIPVQQDRIKA